MCIRDSKYTIIITGLSSSFNPFNGSIWRMEGVFSAFSRISAASHIHNSVCSSSAVTGRKGKPGVKSFFIYPLATLKQLLPCLLYTSQTTQIYAKIVDESKEKAIDLIPDIT